MADESIKPTRSSNPAPLGLLGFGMTTVLLSLYNADVLPLDGVTLMMGVFCGGLVQILAGVMEYRNGNTFGTVAFTLYGAFWLVFAGIKTDITGFGSCADTMGVFCLLWGILTVFLFIGTLRGRTSSKVVFSTLALTFMFLAVADLSGSEFLTVAAGAVGVFCGLSAMYTAFAEVLAEQYGEEVMPF